MNDEPNSEGNLTDEFRTLGRNLLNTLHAAWDRPERKNLQQEIENGLSELMDTLKSEAGNVASSPTGQKVKMEAEDLRQRVQTAEVDTAIRSELLKALQTVNAELKKAATRMGGDQDTGQQRPGRHPSRIVDNRIRVAACPAHLIFGDSHPGYSDNTGHVIRVIGIYRDDFQIWGCVGGYAAYTPPNRVLHGDS